MIERRKLISRKIKLILLSMVSVALIEILLFMQCERVEGVFKYLAKINTLILLVYPAALAASLIFTTISYFDNFKQKTMEGEVLSRKLAMSYLIIFAVIICFSRLISVSMCVG